MVWYCGSAIKNTVSISGFKRSFIPAIWNSYSKSETARKPNLMREREWQSRRHIKSLRQNLTDAEHKLWQELRGRQLRGFKFRRQHPIEHYVADFACISVKLIIEVDGATHSEAPELEYDEKRTLFLQSLGWHVIRFTNTEVFYDCDGVVEATYEALLKLSKE